jgi:putative nucleotidyltransferase with HDIG domain
METSKKEKEIIPKEILYKFAILLVSVFCIVYVLPRDSKNNMQFEEGLPWGYGTQIAEFDFPIYKSDAVVQQEKDSIMAEFTPYCQLEDSVANKQIRAFRQKLSQISEFTYFQKQLLEAQLTDIYEDGVIEVDEYASMEDDNIQQIMVYNNKMATRIPFSQVYTTKMAYETMMNTDSLHLNKAALQRCDLASIIIPNLTYDTERSEEVREELLSSISLTTGMVVAGTKIVDRGEIVTSKTAAILESWKKESEKRSSSKEQNYWVLLGQIIFVTLTIGSFILYLTLFRNDYFNEQRKIILLFGIIVVFPVLTALMVRHNWFSVYILPFAMATMMIRIFMDSRTAFMGTVIIAMISSITLKYPYEFILIQIMAGITSIMALRELSRRSQLINAAFLITLVNIVFYFGFELIHGNDLDKLDINMYKYLCINGVFLLFTYPLLYIIERVFKFTSDVTYVELSNISSPLLQRMSEVSPGTFQHSMQVANLAAEVSKKIGAKTQLVRTGALYHDIGKINNPAFFTENQVGVNPHDSFSELQSAQIVINHINDGIKLAEKYSLPQDIRDFITTHHGTGVTRYFYVKYKNEHPNEEVDIRLFSYPGPEPFKKEHAIVMMADSVEAASRSLSEYTEESIGNLVDKIIDQQVSENHFKECPITFKDIAVAKSVFKEKLKIIYHTRIAYPELKK